MLKRTLYLCTLLMFCSFFQVSAQEIVVCPNHPYGEPEPPTSSLVIGGEECFDKCENWYAPKVVNLHFHVIQDENGERNFQDTDGAWFAGVVDLANQRLANNNHPANPNISFQIEDISYYQQTEWCTEGTSSPPLPPTMDFTLNVYMLENCGEWNGGSCNFSIGSVNCPGGWAGLGGDAFVMHRYYSRFTETGASPNGCYDCPQYGGCFILEHASTVLIHEAGHSFTLGHTFNPDDNFMAWNGCGHDHFNCQQVDQIHNHLENASNVDYTYVPNNSVCEASFEVAEVNPGCEIEITNTSTPSVPNTSLMAEWCVTNLMTDEVTFYNTFDLSFQAEGGALYEICLCISDGVCEVFTCENVMNFDPIPNGFTSDADGNAKSSFCLGEEVFFNGTSSMNESKWFLSIWKYNAGGFAAGESHLDYSRTDPSWQQGEAGIIPLNPIYANFADPAYFEPGYEYRVQFAVQGECDLNVWNAIYVLFTIECCDGDDQLCEAGFTTEVTTLPSGLVKIDVNSTGGYPWQTNNFGVYTHDEPGQGPYTYAPKGSGDGFVMLGTWPGCFTIVNQVTTPCGECCFSQEICIDGGPGDGDINGDKPSIKKAESDCSIIDELCLQTAPTDLDCSYIEGQVILSWDRVPGASEYLVEIFPYDPSCCGQGEGSPPYEYYIPYNTIYFFVFPECFSWRVTAICAEGESTPSEKACFNVEEGCGGGGNDDEIYYGPIGSNSDTAEKYKDSKLTVFPNPTSGQFTFNFNKSIYSEVNSIKIKDLHGRVIASIQNYDDNGPSVYGSSNFDSGVASGVYFLEVVIGDEVLVERVVFKN